MDSKISKTPYIVAVVLAFLIAGSAYYVHSMPSTKVIPKTIPELGAPGSDHAHASMLIMIGDRIINFCSPEYMLKSQYVHFEDNDCTTVHRHATGVTFPTFLKTIGVELSTGCITIPHDKKYCNDGTNTVRAVINGAEVSIADLPYYEIKNNDHILINYGPEQGTLLRFKYNQVPAIPLDVNEPLNTDIAQ